MTDVPDAPTLIQATLDILKQFKRRPAEVLYISAYVSVYDKSSNSFDLFRAKWTFDEFLEAAAGLTDSDEVRDDLMIVGNGWWLQRDTLDGEECWRYFEPPHTPVIDGKNIEVLNLRRKDSI